MHQFQVRLVVVKLEVGSAAAMAAGATVELAGGTPQQSAERLCNLFEKYARFSM